MCALIKICILLITGIVVIVINRVRLQRKKNEQIVRHQTEVRELEKFLEQLEDLKKKARNMQDICKNFSNRNFRNAEFEKFMRGTEFETVWQLGSYMSIDGIRIGRYFDVWNLEEEENKVNGLSHEFWNAMTRNAFKYFIKGEDVKMEDINKCVADYCWKIEDISSVIKWKYSHVLNA